MAVQIGGQDHARTLGLPQRVGLETTLELSLARSKEAFVTERDTAAILLELQRIGVTVASLPDALAATGFRSHSLLAWLRELPSELGTDELLRLLDERASFALATSEHAGSATPLLPELDESLPRQWWPTAEMLEAAIDILVNEWDPIGIRLGSVPHEDFGEYAFHFVSRLLDPWRTDDCLTRIDAVISTVEHGVLGLRASPDVHRRYIAARLREVVRRYPPSQSPFRRPPRSWAISILTEADIPPTPPALDPEGVCGRCGAFGTVACVTFEAHPPTSLRFCAPCWAEVRLDYGSGDRPPLSRRAPVIATESRSWDDAIDFLRVVVTAKEDPERGKEITPELLRQFAFELAADADKMDGPMPAEVETFIREQVGYV